MPLRWDHWNLSGKTHCEWGFLSNIYGWSLICRLAAPCGYPESLQIISLTGEWYDVFGEGTRKWGERKIVLFYIKKYWELCRKSVDKLALGLSESACRNRKGVEPIKPLDMMWGDLLLKIVLELCYLYTIFYGANAIFRWNSTLFSWKCVLLEPFTFTEL